MAELLGIAASVAGLLSLTIQVYQNSANYVHAIRKAPKAFEELLQELQNLEQDLSNLKELSESIGEKDKGIQRRFTKLLSDHADDYRKALETLNYDLEKRTPGKSKRSLLMWPISEERVRREIATLQRYQATIHQALQIDTAYQSAEVVQETRRQRQELENQQSQRLLDWLSPVDVYQKQREVFSAHQESTGQWLLEAEPFLDWLRAEAPAALWCIGNPGTGKTVITSIVVNHLETIFPEDDVGIAFAYCSYKDQSEQTAPDLVATLAKQIAPRFVRQVEELKKSLGYQKPDLERLNALLVSLASRYKQLFVLIDALDECEKNERAPLISTLRALQSLGGSRVRILITCRPYLQHMRQMLIKGDVLEITATASDIEAYVRNRITNDPDLMDILSPDRDILEEMVLLTSKRAYGMFLMAVLQVERIQGATNLRQVKEALATTPKDISGMYVDTIRRIEAQPELRAQLGMRVLSWLLHAKRTLVVEELRHALATYSQEDTERSIRHFDPDKLVPATLLVDVCAGLVIIESESQKITLVHPTTQEYLSDNRALLFGNAEVEISRTCLEYLSFDIFEREGACTSKTDFEKRKREYPYLDYAARFWGDHARGRPELELESFIGDWLRRGRSLATSTQIARLCKWGDRDYSQSYPRTMSRLQTAAYLGLEHTIRLLLQESGNTELDSEDKTRSLYWAASKGYVVIARLLLLEYAARISMKPNLELASVDSYDVNYLISRADDPERCGYPYNLPALHGVAIYDRNPPKRNLSAKESTHWFPALERAVIEGHFPMTRLLLDWGAEVDAVGLNDHTPLQIACARSHEKVVRLLIERGAQVNAAAGRFGTALVMTASSPSNDNEGIVKTLLENGADVNGRGGEHGSALQAAAANGSEATVKILLENGADVNVPGGLYYGALQAAAYQGREAVVKILLENGADVNVQGGYCGSALQAAAENGSEAIVKILLDNGADVNVQGGYCGSALGAAAAKGKEVIVKLLLENGADLLIPDEQGKTAIHWAARFSQSNGDASITTLKLCQELKALEARDKQGRTTLHHAAAGSNSLWVSYLLDMGLDPNVLDMDGWTPLHWACKGYNNEFDVEVVEQLLHRGANITILTHEGLSPSQIAALHGKTEVLSLLLSAQNSVTGSKDSDDVVNEVDSYLTEFPELGRHSAFCDDCAHAICGMRYNCLNCPDFDFCFKCISSSSRTHPADHHFKKFETEDDYWTWETEAIE